MIVLESYLFCRGTTSHSHLTHFLVPKEEDETEYN